MNSQALENLQPSFGILSEVIDFPTPHLLEKSFLKEVEDNFLEIPEKKRTCKSYSRLTSFLFNGTSRKAHVFI